MTLALDHSAVVETALKIATETTINRLTADFDPDDTAAVDAHVRFFFKTYTALAVTIAEQNHEQDRSVSLR